jgi:hypothetical protein
MAQDFAYQNSPSTLGLFLELQRGPDYPGIDMTTVTSVLASVIKPGASTPVTWAFQLVPGETTEEMLVIFHAYQSGDTADTGTATLRITPMVGPTALPPSVVRLPIRAPSLS